MYSYPEPARSSPCLVSSNRATIAHIFKRIGFRLVVLGAFFRMAAPVQSHRGSSVPPMPSITTWIFISLAASVQFGSVASVRTGTGLVWVQGGPKCVSRTARSWAQNIKKEGRLPPYSLPALPPCGLVEVRNECKRDLNATRALLVLEYNIKEERCPPYSLVLRFVCSHPDADGGVECKGDLNASRALLVFWAHIRNGRQTPVQFGKGVLP